MTAYLNASSLKTNYLINHELVKKKGKLKNFTMLRNHSQGMWLNLELGISAATSHPGKAILINAPAARGVCSPVTIESGTAPLEGK